MPKYNYDYNENDYKTPPELYQKALDRWNIKKFDLDVCCSDGYIPAKTYCVNGISDGLNVNWNKYNWCNPPFNECKQWIQKAYNENLKGCKVAMLLPARTETAYYHDYILHNPHVTVEWLRKGYRFLNKDNQEMGVFKNALALVYFE